MKRNAVKQIDHQGATNAGATVWW